MKAKLICAWCDKFLRWTDTSDGRDSHGICRICFDREMAKAEKFFQQEVELRVGHPGEAIRGSG